MERYTDEKHPELSYRIVEVEPEQPTPRRPVWRRFLRIILTLTAVSMLWSTFAPVYHHGCHRHRGASPRPPSDVPPHFLDSVTNTDDLPEQHYSFSPDLKNFWLKQDSFHGLTRTEVVGNVVVVSCSKAKNISAHFKFDVSDDSLVSRLSVVPEEDGILFKLDPFSIVKQKVNATVWLVIPQSDDYQLDELRIGTTQLNIWLKDSFTTTVNATHVTSISGDINALGKASDKKGMDINNLKVASVSGSINGQFPLNHALDIESSSGSITADVVSSNLKEEIGWMKTQNVAGQTTVKFVSILHPRPLYSKHNSVSGDIKVDYPKDWLGGLKLKTTSGQIEVSGKGTKIVKKEKDIVGKFWKVIKGDGKSKGYIGTVSGKIDVLIGNPEGNKE